MWTADSVQITADQTCWTADGYNGCEITGGGSGGGGGANPPQYISEELERKLYPSRKKYEKYKREDKAHLRKSVEAAYAEFIEDDPMLRLMSQEDKAYILAQDDIESIIIILLLA